MDVHVLIATLCLLYLKTAYGQCGNSWLQHGNSCYYISHDKQGWIHAASICRIIGGYLVEVNDADETHILENQLKLSNFSEEMVIGTLYSRRAVESNTLQIHFGTSNVNDNVKTDNSFASFGGVWLGANDKVFKGDWVWAHSHTRLSYTHWSPGEPNDFGGNENCLVLYTNGLWNDQDCGSIFHYICEKDAVYGSIVG